MGLANGESPIEVYLSLPQPIARNPLLLNAALQLAGRPGKGVAKGSPASILYRVLDSIFEEAQAQYFAKNVDPRLEKILTVLPLLTIASTLAVARAKGEDPLEQVSELIDQQCRLGYHAAYHATATITEQILYRSNIACIKNDGLEWSHLLYRDTLIAIMLADRYATESAVLSQALEQAEKTRNFNAPAMALVLMENKLEVDEIFDRLGEFDAVPLVVSFLSLGGSLGEKNLAPFIALLREGAHMDKHRLRTCQYVLSHAYAPIDCLMSLCFIASAREVLEEVAGDVAVEPSLREEIAARLGGSS